MFDLNKIEKYKVCVCRLKLFKVLYVKTIVESNAIQLNLICALLSSLVKKHNIVITFNI